MRSTIQWLFLATACAGMALALGCSSQPAVRQDALALSAGTNARGPRTMCCARCANFAPLAATRPAAASQATTVPAVGGAWQGGPPPWAGRGRGAMMGAGMGQGAMRGAGGQADMARDMTAFHALLDDHQKIKRNVEDIPGGVATTTTSDDPKVAELIRTHVNQMKERIESGRPLRMWDPLFVELFKNADKIRMKVEAAPGGMKVTETSEDPQVTLLIRQHARRGVSEFVKDGWNRVHQATPLPEGYGATDRAR